MKRVFVFAAAGLLIAAGIAAYVYIHPVYPGMLHPHGPIALGERNVIFATFLLSSVVIIPVFALLLIFSYKYHADSKIAPVRHAPNWDHDNWRAELIWWFVPTVIVLMLSLIAWNTAHSLDPYRPIGTAEPLTVEVVALDWKWLFIYPKQGIATVNDLTIPAGVPVRFELTADAPMNSFWIPSLGGQIMVMPGMSTTLNLQGDHEGTYPGSSANLSGEGFSGMTFPVHVVSQAAFDAWGTNIKAGNKPLSSDVYEELRKQSSYVEPLFFSSISSDFYDSVMMRYMPQMMHGN